MVDTKSELQQDSSVSFGSAPTLSFGCDRVRYDWNCKGVQEVEYCELEHHNSEVAGRGLVAFVSGEGADNWEHDDVEQGHHKALQQRVPKETGGVCDTRSSQCEILLNLQHKHTNSCNGLHRLMTQLAAFGFSFRFSWGECCTLHA